MFRDLPILMLAAAALTGCGDSLVSGRQLGELLGTTAPTDEAAWEYRWFSEEGLVVQCDFVDAEIDEDVDVIVGQVEVPVPEVALEDVLVWNAVDGAEYAILLPVLVETELYEPIRSVEEEGELDGELGVWGITAPLAMVLATGDLDAVSDELVFEGADPLEFDEGVAWVELISEVVEVRETLLGAISPLEIDDAEELLAEGIPVTSVAYALDDASEAFSGESLGGVRPDEDCSDDADGDDE